MSSQLCFIQSASFTWTDTSMAEPPVLLDEPWPESPEPRLPTSSDQLIGNATRGIASFNWNNSLSPENDSQELVRH